VKTVERFSVRVLAMKGESMKIEERTEDVIDGVLEKYNTDESVRISETEREVEWTIGMVTEISEDTAKPKDKYRTVVTSKLTESA
jgi:hypothetical protein